MVSGLLFHDHPRPRARIIDPAQGYKSTPEPDRSLGEEAALPSGGRSEAATSAARRERQRAAREKPEEHSQGEGYTSGRMDSQPSHRNTRRGPVQTKGGRERNGRHVKQCSECFRNPIPSRRTPTRTHSTAFPLQRTFLTAGGPEPRGKDRIVQIQ